MPPSYQKGRILAVIEPHPENVRLLRATKRKAAVENLDWEVLVIETPKMYRRLSRQDQENILNTITIARSMGGIVTKLRADSVVDGVQEIINERLAQGIYLYSIKVGEVRKPRKWFNLNTPLVHKLRSRLKSNIRVATVPLGIDTSTHAMRLLLHVKAEEILISVLSVAVATLMIEVIHHFYPQAIDNNNRNTSIIYILACAFVAGRYGLVAGIVAAVSSFLALSLLYIGSYMQLVINDPADAVNLALFLFTGIILSVLGSSDYGNRFTLAKRADRFHSLLEVHRLALSKHTPDETIATLDSELNALLDAEAVIFLPMIMDENALEPIYKKDTVLSSEEKKALNVCWQESKTTGIGAPYCPENCQWRFEPLVTAQDEIGVLGIHVDGNMTLDADFGRLISGVADQVALILERLQIGQMAEANKIQAEREKLRSMLLSSVSHDLKTPLASVIGSLSVYRSMGASLPEEHRQTLIHTALDEAQRLDSFITNILDMTRIESGQISLKHEWMNPAELLNDIHKRLRQRLRNHPVTITPFPQEIEVSMDVIMTGQVIQNLLDNAAKYTKEGTAIDVSWEVKDQHFYLYVRDHGDGIPLDKIESIFDKYSRLKQQDSQVAGTGLGLAIAKAVMQAQQGSITASNHPGGGAVFTLTLPEIRHTHKQKAS